MFEIRLTLKKSKPSEPTISFGNLFSKDSIVPGSGMFKPQKNSFDLKICMKRTNEWTFLYGMPFNMQSWKAYLNILVLW